MKLFVTGDIHGTHSISKLYKENWEEKEYDSFTKEDVMLVTGDLGAVWNGGSEDKEVHNIYETLPFTTVSVRGNHENHELINQLPLVEKFGGMVRKINDSLFFLETGSIYNIGKCSVLAFGGGLSIDKEYRIPGKSWWPEEIPDMDTFKRTLDLLERVKKVDIVLTHAIFQSSFFEIPRKFGLSPLSSPKFQDPLLNMLEAIKAAVKYKKWFCGHYHIDYIDKVNKVEYLYNDIVKIGEW